MNILRDLADMIGYILRIIFWPSQFRYMLKSMPDDIRSIWNYNNRRGYIEAMELLVVGLGIIAIVAIDLFSEGVTTGDVIVFLIIALFIARVFARFIQTTLIAYHLLVFSDWDVN